MSSKLVVHSGKPCRNLKGLNYRYHLSGDLSEFLLCEITGNPCIAKISQDDLDQSTRFFSRARCGFHKGKAKLCPIYFIDNKK